PRSGGGHRDDPERRRQLRAVAGLSDAHGRWHFGSWRAVDVLLRTHHGEPDATYLHHEAGAWRVVEFCGNDRPRECAVECAEGLLLPERNADRALRYRPIGAATGQFAFAAGGTVVSV